ncbi:MAG TPA: ester cyclase, partial [Kofleriaceae bacterium]|nr:ester cyclase [Kofleriaceae bacterium]
MLRRLAFLGCFGCSLLACKKSTDRAPTPGSASGSATAVVGSGSAGSGSAPAKKLTPEARIARYQECLAAFNAGNTDVLKSCYGQASVREQVDSVPELAAEGSDRIVEMVGAQRAAFPDLQITPRLIVVSGDTIAALLHVGGKNSVAAGGMKATNKKLGVFEAEIAVIADDGTFTRDSYYVDQPTVYHQLGLLANDTSPAAIEKPDGAPEIVFAKDDPNEAANKAMIRKLLDSVSEKDAAAIEGL